jgi:hypothetical protein
VRHSAAKPSASGRPAAGTGMRRVKPPGKR